MERGRLARIFLSCVVLARVWGTDAVGARQNLKNFLSLINQDVNSPFYIQNSSFARSDLPMNPKFAVPLSVLQSSASYIKKALQSR